MPSAKRTVEIYSELADVEDQRGDGQMRDRFLILAADAALALGARVQAEQLRERLLEHNPHHLLRPYPSMPEAMQSPDVAGYVADLRRQYPPAEAGRRLEELLSDDVAADEQARQVEALDKEDAAPHEPPVLHFLDAPLEPQEPERRTVRPRRTESAPETQTPEVFPYPSEVASARSPVQDADAEDVSAAGVWFSTGLFGLVLLAGAALLAYTLAWPFVPL